MHVLLIEDDPAITIGLSGALDDLGHQTLETETVAEAIEALRQHPIDLVISDLGLADDVRAETLIEAIRTLYPHMPIIVSTGLEPQDDLIVDANMRILVKPYGSKDLEVAISSLMKAGG